jgi:O-antigen ligase
MALIALLALASHRLSDIFLQADLFRVDSDAPDTRRLQFLFYHHNRAGFFAACGLFLCLVGAWGTSLWRVIGIAGAAGAAIALPFTLTRGALIAAACGMVLFTLVGLLRKRRGRWALLLALLIGSPILWFTLPQNYKAHIEKITNVKNYHVGAGGSIGARFVMWDEARAMIVKRPFLGFGYGFENFESTARKEHPEIPNYFQDAAHAHNHWLETGAEIGMPGLVLLGLFTLVRMSGLAWCWWRSARGGKQWAWLLLLWLSLEVTIQLYGMTNYTLRRNLGYLTYGIWAGSVILCIKSRNSSEGNNTNNSDLPQH